MLLAMRHRKIYDKNKTLGAVSRDDGCYNEKWYKTSIVHFFSTYFSALLFLISCVCVYVLLVIISDDNECAAICITSFQCTICVLLLVLKIFRVQRFCLPLLPFLISFNLTSNTHITHSTDTEDFSAMSFGASFNSFNSPNTIMWTRRAKKKQ